MVYRLRDVAMRYNGREVLRLPSAEFESGHLVSVVGPNGAGKSTLLSILAGLRPGYSGECLLEDLELRRWPRRRLAGVVSFVPQSLTLQFPFTAEQVVLMGRTPHCDGLFESPEDWAAVRRAMECTDTAAFAARDFRSLSGGERQRVVLASALAQSPRVLLLDEPTTFLDLRHQLAIYRLLRELSQQGLLVIAATHDLNLASAHSDRVVMLKDGRLMADAPPQEALHPATIEHVFEVKAETRISETGRTWIVYGE